MCPFLRCLLVMICLLATDAHAQSWEFATLPKAHVSSLTDMRKGMPTQLCDGKINDHAFFSPLKGATLHLQWDEAIHISNLAITRQGWPDWAIASQVKIQINDLPAQIFDLTAKRMKPMPEEQVTFDVLPLAQKVWAKTLSVEILDIQTTTNRHGTFELGLARLAPATIDLHAVQGVPLDASGLQVTMQIDKPVTSLKCLANARRFRKPTQWAYHTGPLPAGTHTLDIPWQSFGPESYFQDPIAPLSISTFELADSNPQNPQPLKLVSWSFTKRDGQRLKPAWEQVTELDFTPDANGWRQGIPMQGFGRFGYMADNGLLVGSLSQNQFQYTAYHLASQRKVEETFLFHCGQAHVKRWQKAQADWTSITVQTLFDYSDAMRNELAAKAPQLIKNRRTPQVTHASILAPGFLIDSDQPSFTIQTQSPAASDVWMLANLTGKTAWIKLTESVDLSTLHEGHLTLVWASKPQLPILLGLAKRPASISLKQGVVQLNFKTPLGRIAMGTPTGYRPWTGKPGESNQASDSLAISSRKLAAILRAYPNRCQMQFKTALDHVQIKETFGHMIWDNDWSETSMPIAPVAPLLSFAASQKYPVTWQTDTIAQMNLPTKYGPYRAAVGNEVLYTLPTPNPHGTFYLAPQSDNPLMAHVSEKIASYDQSAKPWLDRDCLGSWWLWAPATQAFPMLHEKQRQTFEAGYADQLDKNLQPHTWQLRTEPQSGAKYTASFGWIHSATGTLGDVNSGNGAALFGPYTYARTTGDWQLIQNRWPILQAASRYFLLSHDWNNMQTGAREFSGSSAIDMDGIGYEGAIAYWQMASKLGKTDEAAIAQLLASRLAISTCIRWVGYQWDHPQDGIPNDYIGVGLGEKNGFDVMHFKHHSKDHIISELALSLAWVGQYPELFNLHLWGLGKSFWQDFEYKLMNHLPDFRINYKGNRNNHPANVCTNLYLRGLLGESTDQLTAELGKQEKWGKTPGQQVAMENAGFYALLMGKDCPIRLHDWGKARVEQATFNSQTLLAQITINSKLPDQLTWTLLKTPQNATCNGKPITVNASEKPQQLKLDEGINRILIQY